MSDKLNKKRNTKKNVKVKNCVFISDYLLKLYEVYFEDHKSADFVLVI